MPLGAPLFLLNLKTFPATVGPASLRVALELEAAGRSAGVAVAVAPATPDLAAVVAAVRIPVLAQHVDGAAEGPSTGFVPVGTLRAVGVQGSLVNHSEHPVPPDSVGPLVGALGRAGLTAVVCAADASVAGALARAQPPFVAIEPPELIGGSRAVSTAKPEVVVAGVEAVRAVAPGSVVLCGAGIRSAADVRRALELGAKGVLVASAVTLADRPKAAMAELLSGF
jgi:triosephosphate isomerase (TIM)